jgi:DNA topoisomerase I
MVIKFGRFGQFLACENYPECKTTREVVSRQSSVVSGQLQEGQAAKDKGQRTNDESEVPVCEHCGRDMALKKGRFGAFYGCTGYPECKNIRKIPKGEQKPVAAPVELDEICPKDGAKLVKRQGRFGEFVSCSNYPKCDYIKRDTLGIACTRPGCKGEIVVKKSKRGKVFYGCSEYPKCDVVFWDKPVDEPCPQCNAPFLLEKTTKKDGTIRYCDKCDYKASAVSVGSENAAAEQASVSK